MTQASPAAREVKIAVFADCRGPLAGGFEAAIAGANAAFSEFAGARPRSSSKPSAGIDGGRAGGSALTFTEYGCGDGSPGTMLGELERLLVEQDADVLIGPASDDEAIAAARWAKSHPNKTIVVGTAASQEPTMQIAPRTVFRYHGDGAQWSAGLGEVLYRKYRWRSAAVIMDDYSPGWMSAAGFVADFCAIGGKIAKRVFVPLGTADYGDYVRQLPPPNAVDGYFWGVGGPGIDLAFKAFEQAYGPLRAKEHSGDLFQWFQTGGVLPARLTGAYIGGGGVGPGLKTPAAAAYRRVMRKWYPAIPAEASSAVDYYRAARALVDGLKRSKGRAGAPLRVAMPRATPDPYQVSAGGTVRLDSRRQAVQDQYPLQVTGTGTRLGVRAVGYVPAVEQTFGGVFGPAKPAPGRTFPPCVRRKLPWQGKVRVVRNGKVTSEYVK
jgi:branched-chain amino acid transport system substrate-binding protein